MLDFHSDFATFLLSNFVLLLFFQKKVCTCVIYTIFYGFNITILKKCDIFLKRVSEVMQRYNYDYH